MSENQLNNVEPDGYIVYSRVDSSKEDPIGLEEREVYFQTDKIEGLLEDTERTLLRLLYGRNNLPFGKHYYNLETRRFKEQFGEEALQIILEGRLKMIMVLDTPGGRFNQDVGTAKDVIGRGGIVEAFVKKQACSAGALAFEIATHRYALENSEFMWHLSTIAHTRGVVSEQMAEMRKFFKKNVKPELWSQVESKIDEAEQDENNEDNHVDFTAKELYEQGVITELFPDIESISNRLRKSVQGLSTDDQELVLNLYEYGSGKSPEELLVDEFLGDLFDL